MKKTVTTIGVFVLLFVSQDVFSQEKVSIAQEANELFLNGETSTKNVKDNTIVFKGNVSLQCKSLSFEKADQVILDKNTNVIKIYNPKNLKIISVNALTKPQKKESEFITYNFKENTVIL